MPQNKPLTYPGPKSISTPAYPSFRIVGVACLSLAVILGISPSGGTIASFFNKEGAAANAFQAGTWESAPPEKAAVQEEIVQPVMSSLLLSEVQVISPPDTGEQAKEQPAGDDTPPADSDAPPAVALSEIRVVDTPSVDVSPLAAPSGADAPPESPPSE
jgi:hypothetical protein